MASFKNIKFMKIGLKISYSHKIQERYGLRPQTLSNIPIKGFWLRAWLLLLMGRDVETVRFLMLPLPASLEVLCNRVRFRLLTFGIFCFRFLLHIELVAFEFASASSLFHQSASASASTKI